MTSITIPKGVTSIGEWAFQGCDGLTFVSIPKGVTSIGAGTFASCHGLISITIPKGVTSIGNAAFSWCWNLTSILIPESVTTIGNYVFGGCFRLKTIYCKALNPPATEELDTFIDVSDVTLYVPAGCSKAYSSTEPWSRVNIMEYSTNPEILMANRLEIADQKAFVGKDAILPIELINDRRIMMAAHNVYFVRIQNKVYRISL